MIARTIRVDPSLVDGPVMDRDGVVYVRLLVKPQKAAAPLRVFELSLTDMTGKRKRERTAVALFYDGSLVVAASFVLRLTVEYKDVRDAKVEVVYDPATRRAKIRFAAAQGSIDVSSDLRGPDVGRTPEYDEWLEAPPEEQREIKLGKDGLLDLPAAPEVAT